MKKNDNQLIFMEKMGVKQIALMYDFIPDILFWVKDSKHRFIYANHTFLEHMGVSRLENIIGKNDFDFSPPHVARQFIQDDNNVLKGERVTERFEMNQTKKGDLAWFTTTKRPIFDDKNKIIGTYGITRHLQKTSTTLANIDAIKTPVEFIRTNYHNQITVEQLADIAHLSVSALERRFKKHLAKTPKQFLIEIRLEQARKLLIETTLPVSSVCFDTGFVDPSYFSKLFKRFFGMTPSQLRTDSQIDL